MKFNYLHKLLFTIFIILDLYYYYNYCGPLFLLYACQLTNILVWLAILFNNLFLFSMAMFGIFFQIICVFNYCYHRNNEIVQKIINNNPKIINYLSWYHIFVPLYTITMFLYFKEFHSKAIYGWLFLIAIFLLLSYLFSPIDMDHNNTNIPYNINCIFGLNTKYHKYTTESYLWVLQLYLLIITISVILNLLFLL